MWGGETKEEKKTSSFTKTTVGIFLALSPTHTLPQPLQSIHYMFPHMCIQPLYKHGMGQRWEWESRVGKRGRRGACVAVLVGPVCGRFLVNQLTILTSDAIPNDDRLFVLRPAFFFPDILL